MPSALDKALLEMSLEDEAEETFVMPDIPGLCSNERNKISLIGRILNPDHQKVSDVIRGLPRKWRLRDKVRGVALSKERFQFIFNDELDLIDVMEKGVHTFNDWEVVLERWSETPSPNSLQLLEVWIQMGNIPINYYTERALFLLGELIGDVRKVIFDETKTIQDEFVRMKIRFDVSLPLRRVKNITLRTGEKVDLQINYERVLKRCFTCQRLTHDQAKCPFYRKKKEELLKANQGVDKPSLRTPQTVLKEDDPLFGVLKEQHVGRDPHTGRPKIAEEVLEGMRQYLLLASGPERLVREEKVRKSVKEVEKDPLAAKTILRLEERPLIAKDDGKGKGIIFEYAGESQGENSKGIESEGPMLMEDSIKAEVRQRATKSAGDMNWPGDAEVEGTRSWESSICPTVLKPSLSQAGYSGTIHKKSVDSSRC